MMLATSSKRTKTVKQENKYRVKLEGLLRGCVKDIEILKMHVGVMDSAGKPDLFISGPVLGGVWLELKFCPPDEMFDWYKQPTRLQREMLARLHWSGQKVGVLVFFEEFWVSVHGESALSAMSNAGHWDSADPRWARRYYGESTEALLGLVWG